MKCGPFSQPNCSASAVISSIDLFRFFRSVPKHRWHSIIDGIGGIVVSGGVNGAKEQKVPLLIKRQAFPSRRSISKARSSSFFGGLPTIQSCASSKIHRHQKWNKGGSESVKSQTVEVDGMPGIQKIHLQPANCTDCKLRVRRTSAQGAQRQSL